jgi:hypothetical protein
VSHDTHPYGTARISVIDALSQAVEWTRTVLFRPFDLEKWIVLGFCAFLAMLGENGGGSFNWHQGGEDFERNMRRGWGWVLDHLVPVLFIGAVVVLVVLAVWLLFRWLSSRGKFMFLDGVVRDRAAVVEPWNRFRSPGNSLFVLRIVLDAVALVVIGSLIASIIVSVLLLASDRGPEPLLVPSLILVALCVLLVVIVLAVIEVVIVDFLVPVMYLRDGGVVPAWRELGPLMAARPGAFVIYILARIVVSILAVIIVLLACCVTCCCVMIPYVGTVILLPLWVFLRAWPVCLLGQFGPEYARFATLGPVGEPGEVPAPPGPPDPPATTA